MLGNLAEPLRPDLEAFARRAEAKMVQEELREATNALELPPE